MELATADLERDIAVKVDGLSLEGSLGIPVDATGVVAFAHGSGSSRLSPRNQFVARVLRASGVATLLLDLLEPDEAVNRELVFNINFLANRMVRVVDWLGAQESTRDLPIGLFGASTGAAAALVAASERPEAVRAVVSRGGRPDLAHERLVCVACPTLLIVGGADEGVIELNRWAYTRLNCPRRLTIVPGATHLFPEHGALEEVSRHAAEWFTRYLKPRS